MDWPAIEESRLQERNSPLILVVVETTLLVELAD